MRLTEKIKIKIKKDMHHSYQGGGTPTYVCRDGGDFILHFALLIFISYIYISALTLVLNS